MRCLRFIVLAIGCCLVSIPVNPLSSQAYEDTECFKCHTSAKKLIEATREIAKTRPSVTSTETQGEG
jgi:hypothetical protein